MRSHKAANRVSYDGARFLLMNRSYRTVPVDIILIDIDRSRTDFEKYHTKFEASRRKQLAGARIYHHSPMSPTKCIDHERVFNRLLSRPY